MADVVTNGYVSINSVDRSSLAESWEPSWDLEVVETRPLTQTSVAKDVGLFNNSFTVTFIDDTSYTMTQALDAIKGTKVAFELRYDGGSVSASNPKWTGNCIVPPSAPPARQGDAARFTVTFQVDGAVTMATS